MKSFTIGSDPEVILINGLGKSIASVGLIGGSKDLPRKTKHGWVLEDNVLAEFNTKPSKTLKQFINNHKLMLDDLSVIANKHDLKLAIEASSVFDGDQLTTGQAKEAGCEPDYNAWDDGAKNPRPKFETGLRSCGGHLHIAFPNANEYKNKRFDLVKILDLFLGVPSILLDSNQERRKLYGKAGSCRPKFVEMDHPYDGVEYRVLSNFWLKNEQLMAWVYNQVKHSVNDFENLVEKVNTLPMKNMIVTAINESDIYYCEALIDSFNIRMP